MIKLKRTKSLKLSLRKQKRPRKQRRLRNQKRLKRRLPRNTKITIVYKLKIKILTEKLMFKI